MPSNIAIVISDLGSGGAQRVVVTLANAWAASGRRVSLVTLADSDADFYRLDPGIHRIGLACTGASHGFARRLLDNVRRIRLLRAALRGCRATTVLSFIGPTNILAAISCLGLQARLVISERNDPSQQSFGRLWDMLRPLSYWLADRVTANSRGAVRYLSQRVPPAKVFFVPNPVAPPAAGAAAPKQGPFILAVGRLHRQKGYDHLLEAFALFLAGHPEWRLRILGEGPLGPALSAQAEALGIAARIEWLGAVADPFPHYRAADIFALASRHEGTPNALLEAMACGLPCIVTTASSGPLELVQDGVTGLAVPAEDVPALAAALTRLADDPALRSRLGGAGYAHVQANSLANVMQDWELALDFGEMG